MIFKCIRHFVDMMLKFLKENAGVTFEPPFLFYQGFSEIPISKLIYSRAYRVHWHTIWITEFYYLTP